MNIILKVRKKKNKPSFISIVKTLREKMSEENIV